MLIRVTVTLFIGGVIMCKIRLWTTITSVDFCLGQNKALIKQTNNQYRSWIRKILVHIQTSRTCSSLSLDSIKLVRSMITVQYCYEDILFLNDFAFQYRFNSKL